MIRRTSADNEAESLRAERIGRLKTALSASGCRSALVTSLSSVRYLSGFTGSAGAVWLPSESPPVLMTDSRYEEQARFEVEDPFVVRIVRDGWVRGVAAARGSEAGPIAFESESLTVADYDSLAAALAPAALKSVRYLVRRLRETKDRKELNAIERAVGVAESAFGRMLAAMEWSSSPSEFEVAAALEAELRRCGSEPLPFDPIVAAGERSALPHATPSGRAVEPGDLLLIDFGARVDGYCSDMTRMCVLGEPEPWQDNIHERVRAAQRRARERMAAGAGVACRAIDSAARSSLARHELDTFFGHGTGHGIGLEVHEGPHIFARSEEALQAGNVVTIEPGVYLPGRGGVRIEDDVVVEEAGVRVLTRLPRTLTRL